MEPKSEYLREALNIRKAKDASPIYPPRPRTESPVPSKDEFAVQSEDEGPVSNGTGRRAYRRISEVRDNRPINTSTHTPMRRPTQKERDVEREQMSKNNFDLGLRLTLSEQNNTKLLNELEEARKRIEELEPLAQENEDLREENDQLRLQLHRMEEDLAQARDDNNELVLFHDELIVEMEKRDTGLEEAADMIYRLEQQNTELKDEVASYKAVTGGNGESDYYSTEAEGDSPKRQQPDLWSIPESRPSTGQCNSDYYSQPGSPQVLPMQGPANVRPVGPYSTRARTLIHQTSVGARSTSALKKRASHVSIKPGSTPPQGLSKFVPDLPLRNSERNPETSTPSWRPNGRSHGPTFALRALETRPVSPTESEVSAPLPLSLPTPGLRDLYQMGQSQRTLRPRPRVQTLETRPEPRVESEREFNETVPGPLEHFVTPPPRRSSKAFVLAPPTQDDSLPIPSPTGSLDTELYTEPERPENWWKEYQYTSPSRSYGMGSMAANAASRDFMFNANETVEDFAVRTKSFTPRR